MQRIKTRETTDCCGLKTTATLWLGIYEQSWTGNIGEGNLPHNIQGKGMEQIGNVFVFYSGAVDPVLSQRTAQTKRRYKRKEVER